MQPIEEYNVIQVIDRLKIHKAKGLMAFLTT